MSGKDRFLLFVGVLFDKCPFACDCGRCFLCDNAGGCTVISDKDRQCQNAEIAKKERDRLKIIIEDIERVAQIRMGICEEWE